MNSPRLDLSFVGNPSAFYPEDRMADVAEAQIALTLPAIAGLVSGLTDWQRLAVLASTAAKERSAFVEMYGDPFGNERHCVGQVAEVSLASQLSVAVA